jgi:hypothetical protein
MKKVLTFKKEKETKNTFRFQEVSEAGAPPIVQTIYIQKWIAPSDTITVTLEWVVKKEFKKE